MKLSQALSRASRRPMDAAPVVPGAEPFEGGPASSDIGVLFCHGFTGSPASLRPWAEAVADAGHAVSLPRLPGHGTRWQEMVRTEWADWYSAVDRAFVQLQHRAPRIVVAGLSMGGALALRLAEQHDVAGVVLVNPAINNTARSFRTVGTLKHLVPAISSIGGDIALQGPDEVSYDHTPLAPAHSMGLAWRDVRDDLAKVRAPVLLFTSRTDHVVDPSSAALITAAVPHTEQRWLEHSWHVATVDHDAALIQEQTIEFLRGLQ